MKFQEIEVERRTGTGKGVARKLRVTGNIPAIFYSSHSEPISLTVNVRKFDTALKEGAGEFIKLRINEEGGSTDKLTLIKEIQRDVLKRTPLHVDFWEVRMDQEVTLEIPVHLTGTPIGLADGGMLEQIRREITVAGLPGDLTETVEVDVSKMKLGDVLHILDIDLGDKMRVVSDVNYTIATVAAPTVAGEKAAGAEEEGAEEEGAEE